MSNSLFYGDNLWVLKEHIPEESVDLIYLDPPFNSQTRYNVLFETPSGDAAGAQAEAFQDTWHWSEQAETAYDTVIASGSKAAGILMALRGSLGPSDMMAYLANMAVRLDEMWRVLKPTGSLYLHCDPTASHYLKILLDGVFQGANYRSEIIWKRSSAHCDGKQGSKRYGRLHDVILFYTKTKRWKWNQLYTRYDQDYADKFYRFVEPDSGRRYRKGDLTAAKPGGDTNYKWRVKRPEGGHWQSDIAEEWRAPKKGWEYKGVPPYRRRYWAYSFANMIEYARQDRLAYSRNGMPSYKRYLDEMPGVPLQDMWTDINPIGPGAKERLGYPTQKPLSLLDRIINSSTDPGDVVLDPFCGCGTSVHAAQGLDRQWIGIDVTHYAITLIEDRLKEAFPTAGFEVRGRPTDLAGAKHLARIDKYQFQWWANWLVGVQNYREEKKGADRGVDGIIYFKNGPHGTGRVIVSVKGGEKVGPDMVRALAGTVERERAQLGLFVCLAEPTQRMKQEAVSSGFVKTAHGRFPKVQITTVKQLLNNEKPNLPPTYNVTVDERELKKNKKRELDPQLEFLFESPGRRDPNGNAVYPAERAVAQLIKSA